MIFHYTPLYQLAGGEYQRWCFRLLEVAPIAI